MNPTDEIDLRISDEGSCRLSVVTVEVRRLCDASNCLGGPTWRYFFASFRWTSRLGLLAVVMGNAASVCKGFELVIPSIANGLPVTSIVENAYSQRSDITSVVIPNTVTSIGNRAFYWCTGLTNATIPNSVISVGRDLFYHCSNLRNVTIGTNVSSISDKMFHQCTNLVSVSIPDSATSIGLEAFSTCISLTNVTIGSQVTLIGYEAFDGCRSLPGVSIPAAVSSIGDLAFYNCDSLKSIEVDAANHAYVSFDGVLFKKDTLTLLKYPPSKQDQEYAIPPGATSVSLRAFDRSTNLSSLLIPDSVSSFDYAAFIDCRNLTNVSLGAGITEIGQRAFEGCASLPRIDLPESTTHVGDRAFLGCTSLGSVDIGMNVISIGQFVFAGDATLTNIVVDPANIHYSSLDGVLFDKTGSTLIAYPIGKPHQSYVVAYGVDSIAIGAFNGCQNLLSVTFPVTIANIGEVAFYSCSALRGIYFRGAPPAVALSAFERVFQATAFYLPGATGWGNFLSGLRTSLWRPRIDATGTDFGHLTWEFEFAVNWASGMRVIVESSDQLTNFSWTPVALISLETDSFHFKDLRAASTGSRIYRLRMP